MPVAWANGQTTEEALPRCIEMGENIVFLSRSINKSFTDMNEKITPAEIANVILSRDYGAMINLTKSFLESDRPLSNFKKDFDQKFQIFQIKNELVINMIKEALTENRFRRNKFSSFVAECVNEFDGKTKSQSDKISVLENNISNMANKISELEDQLNSKSIKNTITEKDLASVWNKLENYLILVENTSWLLEMRNATSDTRKSELQSSALAEIETSDANLTLCYQTLYEAGLLDDKCAFKLADYLALNSAKSATADLDLSLQVQDCWVVDVGSRAAEVTVNVEMRLNRYGKVDINSIKLIQSVGGSEAATQTAFQAARRAILRCQKDGYKVPNNIGPNGVSIQLKFDPSSMRNR